MQVQIADDAVPVVDFARGDDTGMEFPLHPAAFAGAGAEWLTAAFRRFGVLAGLARLLPPGVLALRGGLLLRCAI